MTTVQIENIDASNRFVKVSVLNSQGVLAGYAWIGADAVVHRVENWQLKQRIDIRAHAERFARRAAVALSR